MEEVLAIVFQNEAPLILTVLENVRDTLNVFFFLNETS